MSLVKDSSSSGRVTLTGATVGLLGFITVSLGLSVLGISTPIKKEFASIPFNVASVTTAMNVVVADYQSGSAIFLAAGIGITAGIAGGIVTVVILVLRSRTKTPSFP